MQRDPGSRQEDVDEVDGDILDRGVSNSTMTVLGSLGVQEALSRNRPRPNCHGNIRVELFIHKPYRQKHPVTQSCMSNHAVPICICLAGLVGEQLDSNYHGNWVWVGFEIMPPGGFGRPGSVFAIPKPFSTLYF